MISSPDSSLLCPSCGNANAPDSKFCRHCGQAMGGADLAASPGSTGGTTETPAEGTSAEAMTTGAVSTEFSPSVGTSEMAGSSIGLAMGDADSAQEERSSPGEIDARRARQLLERAHNFAERNDTAGALLACRQAIALAPSLEGGHAMLGALLERSGDLTHALQAFEKAAQLAPASAATGDAERLRAKMGAKTDSTIFHFDDAELFGDDSAPNDQPNNQSVAALAGDSVVTSAIDAAPELPATPGVSTVEGGSATPKTENPAFSPANPVAETVANPVANPVAETVATGVMQTENPVVAASAALPATALSEPAISAAIPPVRERRVASVAVPVERRSVVSPSVVPLMTPIGARVMASGAAPVVSPVSFASAGSAPPGWSALWARPSYFGRSLPLVGTTVLALGFLGWARGLADARNMTNGPATIAAAQISDPLPSASVPSANVPNTGVPPLAPVGTAPVQNGGFPISNQPAANPAAPPAATQTGASRPNGGAPRSASASGGARNGSRSGARSPQLLAPAPVPAPGSSSANPRPGNAGRSGRTPSNFTLPAPIIAPPAPAAPATSVLPPGSTPPLNPGGPTNRGYVRITQGRVGSALPQRPAAQASDSERAAAAAAQGGSTAQAISGLTAAINANSSDAGFRFQQRATLFLGQRDYGRAAEDFQSAISAYTEQINRGEQVASANAGLRAARNGLNLALAGGR